MGLMLLASAGWAQEPNTSWPASTSIPAPGAKQPSDSWPLPSPSSNSSAPSWPASLQNRPRSAEQPALKQTAMQIPGPPGAPMQQLPRLNPDEANDYLIPLEPPGLQKVFFRLDSEAALKERMRQEGRERTVPERVTFPDEPVVSDQPYTPRAFPSMCMTAEPNYVMYSRLFFEERNSERYGWDLGPIGPVVSAGKFYWDLAFFPYHLATMPFRRFDSNAGQCLPGDPVPLRIYPPQLSVPGTALEAVAEVSNIACFP